MARHKDKEIHVEENAVVRLFRRFIPIANLIQS